jgi:transposase
MVQKLSGPRAMTATALSSEVGIPQGTLSRWLKQAATVGLKMSSTDDGGKVPEATPATKRPQDWTAEEKVALVLEAAAIPEAELGAFLRRKGVHEAQLVEWRAQATEAAIAGMRSPGRADRKAAAVEAQRVRQLERELRRKDKALAETAALLVLKKKAQEIWGDEDDDTDPKSDE